MLIFFKGVHQSRFINAMSAVSVFVVAIAADSVRHMIVLADLNVIQRLSAMAARAHTGWLDALKRTRMGFTLPLMNTNRAVSQAGVLFISPLYRWASGHLDSICL